MELRDIKSWYLDSVRYFRPLGFFSQYAGLSDDELAAKAEKDVCMQWDEPFPPGADTDPQLADMYLLATDGGRVWHGDLEFVYPGEHAYAQFLNGLAAISRGAFRPKDVAENWRGDRGPVDVEFTLDGKNHKFAHNGGDMIDTSVIRMLNGLIKNTGYGFEVSDKMGMPNFMIVLNKNEKEKLAKERHWVFLI